MTMEILFSGSVKMDKLPHLLVVLSKHDCPMQVSITGETITVNVLHDNNSQVIDEAIDLISAAYSIDSLEIIASNSVADLATDAEIECEYTSIVPAENVEDITAEKSTVEVVTETAEIISDDSSAMATKAVDSLNILDTTDIAVASAETIEAVDNENQPKPSYASMIRAVIHSKGSKTFSITELQLDERLKEVPPHNINCVLTNSVKKGTLKRTKKRGYYRAVIK